MAWFMKGMPVPTSVNAKGSAKSAKGSVGSKGSVKSKSVPGKGKPASSFKYNPRTNRATLGKK